jgi:hypothetical protein
VLPLYQSMAKAGPTRAGDMNIVYGLAKILDPPSVVREGEMIMVSNTNSLPGWLVGQINRLNGGQALQPQTRAAIMREAGSRVGVARQALDNRTNFYRDLATRNGFDPRDVLPEIPDFAEVSAAGGGEPSGVAADDPRRAAALEQLKRQGYAPAQAAKLLEYYGQQGPTPAAPITPEQWRKIPEGALFIDQDGEVKPKRSR